MYRKLRYKNIRLNKLKDLIIVTKKSTQLSRNNRWICKWLIIVFKDIISPSNCCLNKNLWPFLQENKLGDKWISEKECIFIKYISALKIAKERQYVWKNFKSHKLLQSKGFKDKYICIFKRCKQLLMTEELDL